MTIPFDPVSGIVTALFLALALVLAGVAACWCERCMIERRERAARPSAPASEAEMLAAWVRLRGHEDTLLQRGVREVEQRKDS